MKRTIGGRAAVFVVGIAVLASAGVAWGDQPPGTGGAKAEPQTADQRLHDSLKDVINRGADLYNAGDANGCYRLFQGALIVTRAQLGHRPDLQKAIDAGVENAGRISAIHARAFALYDVLGDIRGKLTSGKPAETKPADKTPEVKPAPKPVEEKKPEEKKPVDEKPDAKPAPKPADEKKPEAKPAPKPADDKKPEAKPSP